VNALEDETTVAELKRRGLGLTCCPISNSYVTDGTKAREIRTLHEQGVLVTVNSDDPAHFPRVRRRRPRYAPARGRPHAR